MLKNSIAHKSRFCVFIKVYDEYKMLEELLISLMSQTRLPDKVIIIDDGSPNPDVEKGIKELISKHDSLLIQFIKLPLKKKPDLDTVGRTFNKAWFDIASKEKFDYIATIDADTRLEPQYYEKIIQKMDENPVLGCVSGVIVIQETIREYTEQINIGAKVGRKDARGSGKIIRAKILETTPQEYFPEVDWDTWINTRAKIQGYKTPEIIETYMIQKRPTTRVAKKDLYRNGRLTYHFGYNPILLFMKVILAGTGGIKIIKGYWAARREKWRLKDKKVRQYFGWRFFLHF